jgi:DNA-binding PadR family transcriptional regulator
MTDPMELSKREILEIEKSLSDYAEGRFKSGSLEDLLKDLES